jgi:hypothetical protein
MRSDEPGFTSRLPGVDMDARLMTAPGTSGGTRDRGGPVGDVTVRNTYSSAQQSGTAVTVDQGDTSALSGEDSPNGLFGDVAGYVSDGPAPGRAIVDSSGRYPWQQAPGGA